MEFIEFLNSQNLVEFESIRQVCEAAPYNLKIKEDEMYPTLYLVCQTDNTPQDISFVKDCNGIIMEKGTNKIICYTFPKGVEMEGVDPKIDQTKSHLEIAIEGALIRLFHYNDMWIVSTKKCINAKRAKWLTHKSFEEMFQEVFPMEILGGLDVNESYSFILCHPENSMVVQYPTAQLYHISTRNMTTMMECEKDIGIAKVPRHGDISILSTLSTTTDLTMEGYMLVDENFNRQKFMSPIYKRAREVWGNTNYRFFRYLELRKEGNDKMVEYLTFFPGDQVKFMGYEQEIIALAQEILQVYLDRHVHRNGVEIPQYYKRLIYDLHGEFLKTRVMTNLPKVMEWIEKLDAKLVCFLYNKSKESKNPQHVQTEMMVE